MRLSTLAFIVLLLAGVVGGGYWYFGSLDGFLQWKGGFRPATTPEQAMEKFRDAIQQRKYSWAATYCTKDFAEVLVKADGPAARLGEVIDKIRAYMENIDRKTDQTVLLLQNLDPFPANFKVQGAVKQVNDREAVGVFAWEPVPLSGTSASLNQTTMSGLDAKMFYRTLTPPQFFAASGIKIVKEGEHWKLKLDTTPASAESVRYFLDKEPAHESELRTFRTYMLNGRYDSGKAFESEVVDALKKANSGAR
jgi:hypothetical protein